MENGIRVDAVNSTTYADRVDGQRNVTVEYGEPTVTPGPFAVSRACPPCCECTRISRDTYNLIRSIEVLLKNRNKIISFMRVIQRVELWGERVKSSVARLLA